MSMNVSVIIPVYNAEPFVKKAVYSALDCPEVKEVLLIEDFSQDNSYQVCKEIAKYDSKIKLYRTSILKNQGASVARNIGLENAVMDYISFLDADDFYLPNRFFKDRLVFESNSEAEGVYNCLGVHFYSDAGRILYESTFRQGNEFTTLNQEISYDELFPVLLGIKGSIGYFHLNTLTIKKSSLEKMAHWFNQKLKLHQDTEFILRMACHCKLYPSEIKNPVAIRGIHENNRITHILTNQEKISLTQYNLWSSLYRWSQKHVLNKECKDKIQLMYVCKSLKIKPKAFRFSSFMYYLIATRGKLLRHTHHYQEAHYTVFGKNKISRVLLKTIKYIQKFFRERVTLLNISLK